MGETDTHAASVASHNSAVCIMAYSAERIGSEQHALDSKKRRTEKDDLQRKTKRMKNHKQKQEGWCKDVSPWQPETQNARSNKQSVQGDQ